ncbi:hypothetical protein Tco_1061969, partial [Tanacetum coccineum]
MLEQGNMKKRDYKEGNSTQPFPAPLADHLSDSQAQFRICDKKQSKYLSWSHGPKSINLFMEIVQEDEEEKDTWMVGMMFKALKVFDPILSLCWQNKLDIDLDQDSRISIF